MNQTLIIPVYSCKPFEFEIVI